MVALHLLYAAVGFLDSPSKKGSSAYHFAQQSWSQTLGGNVRALISDLVL